MTNIEALIQDVRGLNEDVEFQEQVIETLLGYFKFETGLRSLDDYLKSTLDDDLESTNLYLNIMERVI